MSISLLFSIYFAFFVDTIPDPIQYFEGKLSYEVVSSSNRTHIVSLYIGKGMIRTEVQRKSGDSSPPTEISIVSNDFPIGSYYLFHPLLGIDTLVNGATNHEESYEFTVHDWNEACPLGYQVCKLAVQSMIINLDADFDCIVTDSIWFSNDLILELPTNIVLYKKLFSAYNHVPIYMKKNIESLIFGFGEFDQEDQVVTTRLISVEAQKLDLDLFDPVFIDRK